ncbi:MAG: LysR family transcriptional regulator [Pseudomonadota bacterium]
MSLTNHLLLFVKLVDKGSFTAVARDTGVSKSAVSRQFRQLEDELGIRLLNRTTRKIVLTEAGKRIYDSAERVVRELDELEAFALEASSKIVGRLQITSTVAFGKAHLLPLIPRFLDQHSKLNFDLELTDRPVDLVAEGKDLAIRFYEQVDSDSVVVRRLAQSRRLICASPEYLDRHGVPTHPDDLLAHNCLRSSNVAGWNGWEFDIDGTKKLISVRGNFKANSADATYRAALSGLGIARLSEYLVCDDLSNQRLVRLLDEYAFETSDLMVTYPDRRNLSPKVRAFLDFLIDEFTPNPPWARSES